MPEHDYLVVGAGIFGSVFAREMADRGKRVLVVDKRTHIGGNCYTENVEGVNVHRYGAHIFHTSDKEVWDYVNRFAAFNRYTNSPLARWKDQLYSLPFNMNTFRQLWGVTTPEEAMRKIEEQRSEMAGREPTNLEEQAISLVGRDIYERLIKGYTEKQWGRSCQDLPAFIIRRLPVRFTYDNNYFNDRFQGIPEGGYTGIFERMLEGIEVRLGVDYLAHKGELDACASRTVYTGPIDAYFGNRFGVLEYRSVRFETEVLDIPNFQGNAVVNYTERDVPFTRIIEHKHFEFGTQEKTVVSREYSSEWAPGDEPYYPVNDDRNNRLAAQYHELASREERMIFGGRLADYKYYDMHHVVRAALVAVGKEAARGGFATPASRPGLAATPVQDGRREPVTAFVEVSSIRPGGGPPGYVSNLLKGERAAGRKDAEGGVRYVAVVPEEDVRNKAAIVDGRLRSPALARLVRKAKDLAKAVDARFVLPLRYRFTKKWKAMTSSDVVVFHGFQDPFYLRALKGVRPTVYMPHCPTIAADEISTDAKALGRKYTDADHARDVAREAALLENADWVVFASPGAGEEYRKAFPAILSRARVEHLQSGIDFRRTRDLPLPPEFEGLSGPIVLFAGRYIAHKGYDLYGEAVGEIASIATSANFLSIGGGPVPPAGGIRDLGWRNDPFPYIRHASIVVVPNRVSYFDLFPLECAALGKPLVMTRVGGNIDQLAGLPDAIGSAPGDAKALGAAILEAIEKVGKNPEWGEGNAAAFQEYYSSRPFADRWENLLQRVRETARA